MATEQKTPTKLQKALDFKAKYEALIAEAKDEALAQIKEAVDSLKDLGLTYYVLSEEEYNKLTSAPTTAKRGRPAGSTNAPKAKTAASPSANFKPEFTCKVCGIPGHNTRAHNFHPEKFTPEELAAKGIVPPQ